MDVKSSYTIIELQNRIYENLVGRYERYIAFITILWDYYGYISEFMEDIIGYLEKYRTLTKRNFVTFSLELTHTSNLPHPFFTLLSTPITIHALSFYTA